MSKFKRQPDDTGNGPLLTTVVCVAAEQLADVAVCKATVKLQDFLHGLCFTDQLVIDAGELPGWGTLVHGLEALIREAWAADAAKVEATMREEGVDPEALAGLKTPIGTLLS